MERNLQIDSLRDSLKSMAEELWKCIEKFGEKVLEDIKNIPDEIHNLLKSIVDIINELFCHKYDP